VANRTVFITGCSSGIGRAAALFFAARGYRVIATSRNVQLLSDLEDVASKNSWLLRAISCDVGSNEQLCSAVDFARQTFGPVHVLVNNAGYGQMGAAEHVPMEDARRQFEINVFGPLRLIQLLAPDMRAAGWGRIINVSSIAGRIAIPFGSVYSASKSAMEGMADALRLELEPFGIHTVSILPGPVTSSFMQNTALPELPPDGPRYYQLMRERFLVRRTGRRPFEIRAERVARVIVRVAEVHSPRPRYYLTAPARLSAFGSRFVSDRMMDRFVRAFYGLYAIEREANQR
jgi:NAD(P)-dependent dehydrogenase (short-subunit alcohol dehydrogenase family)